MKNNNPLLKSAEDHIFNLFKSQLKADFLYHNFKHTAGTVKACKTLYEAYNLNNNDYEKLMLAAWFHDAGYVKKYEGHEEESVKLLRSFLNDYPANDLKEIESLILSTRPSVKPEGILQEILHDADYIRIGKKKFEERAALLRIEWERMLGKTFTEAEWAAEQLDFLISSTFYTEEALAKYNNQREENIRSQYEVVEALATKKQKQQEKTGKSVEAKPVKEGRGIETLYRSVYEYHINLSSIADNKANIMISINTIIVSLVITLFGTGFTFSSQNEFGSLRFVFPMTFLLISSLLAVIFAILSSRPNITSKEKYELNNKQSSVLFFGNFVQLQLNEFVNQIKVLKKEREELYDSMSIDIYHLGGVLLKKYRLLTWSYNIFMGGLVLVAVSFIVIMIFSYEA